MNWLPIDTSHYKLKFCKQRAKELRKEGRKVRIGAYLKEKGETYAKIYVENKNG